MAKVDFANLITRTIGFAGLGAILYDSHGAGKYASVMQEKNHKSEMMQKDFFNSMSLDSPSHVKAATKKRIFQFFADENFTGFFTTITGYCKGFSSMLVNNVIPLGLALGTVLAPKGIISKCFGAGLLAYGGIFLLQEIFGIGKHKQ